MNDQLENQAPPPGPPVDVSGMLNGPAMGLMVAGGLGILSNIFGLLVNLGVFAFSLPFQGGSRGLGSFGMQSLGTGIQVAIILVALLVNGFIIFGAMQMKSQKNYGMAMGAAIAALIPCFSSCPCCFVSLGMGIWALIILLKPEVKSSFAG